ALTRSVAADITVSGLAADAARTALEGTETVTAAVVDAAAGAEPRVVASAGAPEDEAVLRAARGALAEGRTCVTGGAVAAPIFGAGPAEAAVVAVADPERSVSTGDIHFVEEIAGVLTIARGRERAAALEAELARTGRLRAVGRLAGGV